MTTKVLSDLQPLWLFGCQRFCVTPPTSPQETSMEDTHAPYAEDPLTKGPGVGGQCISSHQEYSK